MCCLGKVATTVTGNSEKVNLVVQNTMSLPYIRILEHTINDCEGTNYFLYRNRKIKQCFQDLCWLKKFCGLIEFSISKPLSRVLKGYFCKPLSNLTIKVLINQKISLISKSESATYMTFISFVIFHLFLNVVPHLP